MYRTILVGYDGREGARDALALARGLAAIEGAGLVLLRRSISIRSRRPADAYERAMAEAEERLSAAARGSARRDPVSDPHDRRGRARRGRCTRSPRTSAPT